MENQLLFLITVVIAFVLRKKKLPRDKIDVQYYSALMSTFTYNFLKFMSKTNRKQNLVSIGVSKIHRFPLIILNI